MASGRLPVLITYEPRLIAKYLNQKLAIGLSPEDINNPTADIAQQVYFNFLKRVLNVSEQSLTSLPLSAVGDYDPDMHRNSIPIIIVYNCLKAFVEDNSGGKLQLSMCDLVDPVQNRFRKITSLLVDFMKMNEVAMPYFGEISEEFSERKQQKGELEQELEQTERRKNELIAQQSLRKRREHDLIAEHTKVNEELSALIAAYTQNVETSENIKKQETELVQKIEKLESEILSEMKMIEHLNEEILSSPEELKKEIAERKRRIAELQEDRRSQKKFLATQLEDIDICSKVEKKSSTIADKIQGLSNLKSELLEQLEQLNIIERDSHDVEEELKFVAARKRAVDERMVENEQSHQQIRQDHVQRDESLKQRIAELEAEIKVLNENQPCVSKEIEQKRNELLEVKNSLSESISKDMIEMQEATTKFQKITALFEARTEKNRVQRTAFQRAVETTENACFPLSTSEYTFSETTDLN